MVLDSTGDGTNWLMRHNCNQCPLKRPEDVGGPTGLKYMMSFSKHKWFGVLEAADQHASSSRGLTWLVMDVCLQAFS